MAQNLPKIDRNYEKFEEKALKHLEDAAMAKREKQSKEMKLIEDQIKENQERAQKEKLLKEEENRQIRQEEQKNKEVESKIVEILKEEYERLYKSNVPMKQDQEQDMEVDPPKEPQPEVDPKSSPQEVDLKDVHIEFDKTLNKESKSLNEENNSLQADSKLGEGDSDMSPKSVILNPIGPDDDQDFTPPKEERKDGPPQEEAQKSEESNSAPSVRLNRPSDDGEGDQEVSMEVDKPQDLPEASYEEELVHENEDEISSQDDEDLPIDQYISKMLWQLADILVERTEERKELMDNLEQRRKKWILWGKKKAKEANQKAAGRKTWNIEKKNTRVRKELETVF